MSKLGKLFQFLSSRDFRTRKIRQWGLPVLCKVYPNIELLGVRGTDGKTTIMYSQDRFITLKYIVFGHDTDSKLSEATAILTDLQYPLGGVFLDVGANIGTDTLAALESGLFSSAVTIEPELQNFRLTRANAVLHGVDGKLIARRGAVADKDGLGELTYSNENRGDHRITMVPSGQEAIQVKSLDTHLREVGVDASEVSLVWVDTQGFEGFVLAGADSLITAKVPFVIEFWPPIMKQAGCYELCLKRMLEGFRSFYNLHSPSHVREDISGVEALANRLGQVSVDLLLLP